MDVSLLWDGLVVSLQKHETTALDMCVDRSGGLGSGKE